MGWEGPMNCPVHVSVEMVPMESPARKPKRGRWKKRGRGRALTFVGETQDHQIDAYDELPAQERRMRCPVSGCPQVKIG